MNMTLPEIQRHLGTLRLHGMNATLEPRLIQANQGASFVEVFACLVQDELDYRSSRTTEARFKASGLAERPTLTEFDWGFNPKLPKKEIYELVTGKFIRDGDDALLIGSAGTGKSHIAKTVAHAAIQTGYRVVYREAHSFFADLFEATQLKRRKRTTKVFSQTDLLIIDDLFLRKTVPEQAADDLLDIILNRYSSRKSSLITSNRPLEDWGKLLRDNAASSAILDRLLHRGHLLKFEGKSYRLKEASIRLTKANQNLLDEKGKPSG
ncbi:MAG TPA: IS21-like element helper ATPase IstB [Syntrophobacteraceae bacterium]|nr:IS21-like element helper ATPase IstB [Syntrophobacteraceae bacterium]